MTRTPDPLITNEVLYQLSYCGCICPSKQQIFATTLLVKPTNHINIAILCRGSLAARGDGSEKLAQPSGFRHLFRDRIASGRGRRTGDWGALLMVLPGGCFGGSSFSRHRPRGVGGECRFWPGLVLRRRNCYRLRLFNKEGGLG